MIYFRKLYLQILLLICIPILIQILGIFFILSLNIQVYYKNKESLFDRVYQDNKFIAKQLNQIKGQQIQSIFYDDSIQLNIIQNLIFKAQEHKVIFNPHYIPPLANIKKIKQGKEIAQLQQIYNKNQQLIDGWAQSEGISDMDQLQGDEEKQILINLSHFSFIMKIFSYQKNIIGITPKNAQSQIGNYFFGYQYKDGFDGDKSKFILFSSLILNTIPQTQDDSACQNQIKEKFDLECFSWFSKTKKQQFFQNLSSNNQDGQLNSLSQYQIKLYVCLDISKSKENIKFNDNTLIACNQIELNQIDEYFKVIEGSVNYYSILQFLEANSQLHNSFTFQLCQQNSTPLNQTINCLDQSFLKEELSKVIQFENDQAILQRQFSKYQESQERIINSSIENYSTYTVYSTVDYFYQFYGSLNEKYSFYSKKILVIVHFFFLRDVRDNIVFFINIVEWSFKILCLILIVFFSIVLLAAIYYTNQIYKAILNPINYLIDLFKQIQLDTEDLKELIIDSDDILEDLIVEEIFESLDTLLLYECFKNLVRMLKYRSQNIFCENESKTLLNMTAHAQFFKQFMNYQELGILYNNIGNIHFFEERYFEALESYQNSIVCAKIQLEYYQETGQSSLLKQGDLYSKENSKSLGSFLEKKDINLLQNLFNRKYNFYKCLNAYYEKQNYQNAMWEELGDLIIELENIGRYLENSYGRNIFLLLGITFIKFSTQEMEQAKEALDRAKQELESKEEFEQIQVRNRNRNRHVSEHDKQMGIKLMQRVYQTSQSRERSCSDISEISSPDKCQQKRITKKESLFKLITKYKEERENYNQSQFLRHFTISKKNTLLSSQQNQSFKIGKRPSIYKNQDSKQEIATPEKIISSKLFISSNQVNENTKTPTSCKERTQSNFLIGKNNSRPKDFSSFLIQETQPIIKNIIKSLTPKNKQQIRVSNFQNQSLNQTQKEEGECSLQSINDKNEIETKEYEHNKFPSIQDLVSKNPSGEVDKKKLKKLIKYQKFLKKESLLKQIDQNQISNYDFPLDIMKSYYTLVESLFLIKEKEYYKAACQISDALQNSSCYQTYPKRQLLIFFNRIVKSVFQVESDILRQKINKFNEITSFKISLVSFCKKSINKYITYQLSEDIIDYLISNENDSFGVISYKEDFQELNSTNIASLNCNPLPDFSQILPMVRKDFILKNRELIENNLVQLLDFLKPENKTNNEDFYKSRIQNNSFLSEIDVQNTLKMKRWSNEVSKQMQSNMHNKKTDGYFGEYNMNNHEINELVGEFPFKDSQLNINIEKSRSQKIINDITYFNSSALIEKIQMSPNNQSVNYMLKEEEKNSLYTQSENKVYQFSDFILSGGCENPQKQIPSTRRIDSIKLSEKIQRKYINSEKINLIIHLGIRKSIATQLFNDSIINYHLCRQNIQFDKNTKQFKSNNSLSVGTNLSHNLANNQDQTRLSKEFKNDLCQECQKNKEGNKKEQVIEKEDDFLQKNKIYKKVQKKFIIMAIDQEGFQYTLLYKELCALLENMDIELLILLLEKNQSMEEMPTFSDHRYSQNLIQYFYSYQKLLQYIFNQREQIQQKFIAQNVEYYQTAFILAF